MIPIVAVGPRGMRSPQVDVSIRVSHDLYCAVRKIGDSPSRTAQSGEESEERRRPPLSEGPAGRAEQLPARCNREGLPRELSDPGESVAQLPDCLVCPGGEISRMGVQRPGIGGQRSGGKGQSRDLVVEVPTRARIIVSEVPARRGPVRPDARSARVATAGLPSSSSHRGKPGAAVRREGEPGSNRHRRGRQRSA